MNPETYLAKEFFAPVVPEWEDRVNNNLTHTRETLLCPIVVTAEDADNLDNDSLILVYGQNGDGEFDESLGTQIIKSVGFDVVAFLRSNPALGRFQERFMRLFAEQPTSDRVTLAQLASTNYNDDLRAYSAQWSVNVLA